MSQKIQIKDVAVNIFIETAKIYARYIALQQPNYHV